MWRMGGVRNGGCGGCRRWGVWGTGGVRNEGCGKRRVREMGDVGEGGCGE